MRCLSPYPHACVLSSFAVLTTPQVTVRRWVLDAVASVHCADARMMDAMLRMVPAADGQSHLSPDGSGLLIALHIPAVSSFVQVSGVGVWSVST